MNKANGKKLLAALDAIEELESDYARTCYEKWLKGADNADTRGRINGARDFAAFLTNKSHAATATE